jgi:hypothetical protein
MEMPRMARSDSLPTDKQHSANKTREFWLSSITLIITFGVLFLILYPVFQEDRDVSATLKSDRVHISLKFDPGFVRDANYTIITTQGDRYVFYYGGTGDYAEYDIKLTNFRSDDNRKIPLNPQTQKPEILILSGQFSTGGYDKKALENAHYKEFKVRIRRHWYDSSRP